MIAGALILVLSSVALTFIFPDAIPEMQDAYTELIENSGLPQAQMDKQLAKLEEMTAVSQAVNGSIGTIVTSLIIAAITGIFLRRK